MLRLISLCLCTFVLLFGCQDPAPPLQAGTWNGGLSPMNHPEMMTPLSYAVGYDEGALTLTLQGPGGTSMPARNVRLEADTLRFAFDEPEEGVELRCALGRDDEGGRSGRCVDASGKWARFTMTPPTSRAE